MNSNPVYPSNNFMYKNTGKYCYAENMLMRLKILKWNEEWSSTLWKQFMQFNIKKPEKIEDLRIYTHDLTIPVRRSIKPTKLWSHWCWELVNYVFMFPWKRWAGAARRVGVQVAWWCKKISTPCTRIPPAMLATGILNPCWNWQLWDVEAQKKLRSMAGHSARVGCLSWNSFILSRYDSWNLLNLLFQRFERIVECWNILLQFDKKKLCFFTSWHYLDII